MKTKFLISILAGIILSTAIGYWVYLDEPKTPWDCRQKYGKVKEDIERCVDKINNPGFFSIPQAFGICMENPDWPNAPCYGCPNCYPGLEQEKLDWSPYFEFKGAKWMEEKKNLLDKAVQEKSLREWFDKDESHRYIHNYYFLQGQAPSIYGMYFDDALGFEKAWNAVKNGSRNAPLLLWSYHDIILDGKIIEKSSTQSVMGDSVPSYTIKANQYFKGKQNAAIVVAIDNLDDLDFELFDEGLFYLKKIEHENRYVATIVSVKTSKLCDARSLIEISPVLPNEGAAISSPAVAEESDPCVADYYDADPDAVIAIKENEDSKILPPLKQIKNGVALADIQCPEGFSAVPRSDRMMIACVYPDTEGELLNRGWAALRLGDPATDNLPRDLCSIYDGKWLSESKECINLENPLQCSLMGGAYNECASACRNDPAYPDVACDDVCVEVCSIEYPTLEDIMKNPVVEAFYLQYGEMNSSVSNGHVKYHAGDNDGFSATLTLYFDDKYNLQHIEFHCYEDKQHQYEIAQEDILNHLKNYHCETFGKGK